MKLELLPPDLIARILDEAFQLMLKPGIKVQSDEARQLLASAGADVDEAAQVVRIPEKAVRDALAGEASVTVRPSPSVRVSPAASFDVTAGAQAARVSATSRVKKRVLRSMCSPKFLLPRSNDFSRWDE